MPKYQLVGDILHPGRVEVEARDLKHLAELLGNGGLLTEFNVVDKQNDCLAFQQDGPIEDEGGNEVQLPVEDK